MQYNWEQLLLSCIDSGVCYTSAAVEFSLVLELLGWEAPSLALAASLFLACAFTPPVRWTVQESSHSRENSALQAHCSWLNWLGGRVSYFFRRTEMPWRSWLLHKTKPVSDLSVSDTTVTSFDRSYFSNYSQNFITDLSNRVSVF